MTHVANGSVAVVERKKAAAARNKDRIERSPEEQIAALDARLGAGVGATRERARLTKQSKKKEKK